VRLAELVREAGSLSFKDVSGRDFTAELSFWTGGGKLDALLEKVIDASERAIAKTIRAA